VKHALSRAVQTASDNFNLVAYNAGSNDSIVAASADNGCYRHSGLEQHLLTQYALVVGERFPKGGGGTDRVTGPPPPTSEVAAGGRRAGVVGTGPVTARYRHCVISA
jgi:hypothetical protein